MGNFKATGLTALILLIITMIVVMGIASIITGETSTSTTTELDYDQIVDDVLNEITTYIQIKDEKGKFSKIEGEHRITKIALLISPMVSQDIDMTQLTIQIDNGEMVNIMYYEESDEIGMESLFEHNLWNNLNGSKYSLISINDFDDSISEFNLINQNSDLVYLVFKLPSNLYMEKYDTLKVTLFPSTGITRTTFLKAPMPMKQVITFE